MVVRIPDGSALKLPRHWTDADGRACTELSGHSTFTLYGLRELLVVFLSLRKRHRVAVPESDEKIEALSGGAERVDAEATTTGVYRRGAARNAVESVPGGGKERGHATLCSGDGAHGGATHPAAANKAGGGR